MAALCEMLGDPHQRLSTIHLVGTDAKTSTALMTGALVRGLGATTGETISPHLTRINERIRLDGEVVSDQAVVGPAERVEAQLSRVEQQLGESVTFFEAVTATALVAFVERQVDVAVVEAGIGGVGDATGVLAAPTVMLTPVSMDHPQLGSTLEAITREKIGVAKPGATVIMSRQHPEVTTVVQALATQRRWQLLQAGHQFGVVGRTPHPHGQVATLRTICGTTIQVHLPLYGRHQADNASVALAAAQAHLGISNPDHDAVVAAFAAVAVPGRTELTSVGGVDMLIDGAHDVTAADALARVMDELVAGRNVIAIVGCSAGRDPWPLVRRLGASSIIATAAGSPGAEPAGIVARRCAPHGGDIVAIADVEMALRHAIAHAGTNTLIVVVGSLHLAGEIRAIARRMIDDS